MKHIAMKHTKLFLLVASLLLLAYAACTPASDNTPGTDERDALVGNWTTTETSRYFGKTTYTITVSKSTSDDITVIMKNFFNLGAGTSTLATVSGKSITIASQQVSAQAIKGSGTLGTSSINWSYTTDDGVQRDTCTAVSVK